MRVFSFAQESTRYCNYSKDKFGNEVTFITPSWLDITTEKDELHLDGDEDSVCYPEDVYTTNFLYTLRYAERVYMDLLTQWEEKVPDKRFKSGFRNNPWTPQQARAILPNALKTELVMTGFVSDWWGEYLVFDKNTGLLDQRIHGMFWEELDNIDKEKYRIAERGFFPLRCSDAAHPQARELAIPLREEFKRLNFIC